MTLKGIKTIKPKTVDLSKYFDYAAYVIIRPLPVPSRAKIQELTTNGMRYMTSQARKKLDIDSIEQSMPQQVTMDIRAVKLTDGVIEHNIQNEEGKVVSWCMDLWDALDDCNQAIIQKIIDEITDLTYPEDEADPT